MEKKDLILAENAMNEELESFRKQFNIEPERFYKAVEWCEKVLEGGVKSKVYSEVFDVTLEKARTVSGQFHRTKWVQELILFLRPDEQSLYFGERKRIIQAGMAIIDDPRASHRDKTEAIKALQPYIKAEASEREDSIKTDSLGEAISKSITEQIAELASRGKMLDSNGQIVDVVLIE